ncbi:hypothetical protein IJU97_04095 [bacterium]|nr:hypothetical protein [bacterium]
MDEVIESLKRNSNIEYVEPNYLRYFFSSNENLSTDDTHKGEQRSLEYIDWVDAYNLYSGVLKNQQPVVVAVVDNGVNYNHVDLSSSMRSPEECALRS